MKKVIVLLAVGLVVTALSFPKNHVEARGVHVSHHSSIHSRSHITSRKSVRSYKTKVKSGKATSFKTPSNVSKVKVGGEEVTKDSSAHTIKNSTSKVTYNEKFYNKYQPHIYRKPSIFTWLWFSNLFHHGSNVNQIKGIVLSKDGDCKLTIDDKGIGEIQVKVSKEVYDHAIVGHEITVK